MRGLLGPMVMIGAWTLESFGVRSIRRTNSEILPTSHHR